MRFGIKTAAGIIVMLLGLIAFSAGAAAQGFSADVVAQNGQETIKGKIYVSRDRMRFESGGTVTITRLDKNIAWILMPQEKMFMEQSLRPDTVIPGAALMVNELNRTLLGREAVHGIVADKYRILVKNGENQGAAFLWLAGDTGLPVKTAAVDGKWWQEYYNIVTGEPAVALFEIPDGYQSFSMSSYF